MSTIASMPAPLPSLQSPRLLDQVRQAAFARFGRAEPGERYVECIRRYIIFHAGLAVSLRTIQVLLGHESLETTMLYRAQGLHVTRNETLKIDACS